MARVRSVGRARTTLDRRHGNEGEGTQPERITTFDSKQMAKTLANDRHHSVSICPEIIYPLQLCLRAPYERMCPHAHCARGAYPMKLLLQDSCISLTLVVICTYAAVLWVPIAKRPAEPPHKQIRCVIRRLGRRMARS
jgi:hypothetical protein